MADLFREMATTSSVLAKDSGEEMAGYAPLPLRNLVVGAPVGFDVFLKIKPKGQTAAQFMRCCPAGEEFQQDWLLKLNKLQIPYVYFAAAESGQVAAYLQHHLELTLASKKHTEVEKATMACDAAQIWNLNFFSSEQSRTGEQVKLAFGFLDPVYEVIQKSRGNLLALLGIRRQGLRLYAHCLQVSMLGMAFTSYLGWTADMSRHLGLGFLIHDIGMSPVPLSILNKPGPLTKEETAKIRRHPVEGFRMMKKNTQLRFEALHMIYQHHENGNGSGYPDGLKLTAIHPWARILRIVDSYEAMTSERPWRPAMDPKKALWTMLKSWETDKIYDASLLKAFFKFLAS